MADRIVMDLSTREETVVAVDDTWIIANKSRWLELSWDGGTNTLSAQLKTPELTDLSRNDVSEVETWTVTIGETEVEIATDANGQWNDTLEFADPAQQLTVYAAFEGVRSSNEIIVQDGV